MGDRFQSMICIVQNWDATEDTVGCIPTETGVLGSFMLHVKLGCHCAISEVMRY